MTVRKAADPSAVFLLTRNLVEVVELPGHPWFLATQFHPEFTSNPRDGHPLFRGFITAARNYNAGELPRAAEA